MKKNDVAFAWRVGVKVTVERGTLFTLTPDDKKTLTKNLKRYVERFMKRHLTI